jgi:serpin B
MKIIMVLTSIAILLTGLTACAQPASTPAEASVLKSDKPRITSPNVPQGDLDELVSDNSTFALDLYQQLKESDGNLFYSPYSISLALAMTYAGARGETEEQMARALDFGLPQDRLHPAFNSLAIELAKRGEGAKGKDDEGFRLNIVNAIWGQKDYEFLNDFLDTLAENYGAGLRILDFIGAPEESRITINDWVSEQTEGKIKDLIPQGMINSLTRLVLTNAIYFNAAWAFPFSEHATSDGLFHLINGDQVTVPMMRQTDSFGYAEGDNYQAVELPYDGNELSMVILLPESGQFPTFEGSLDFPKLEGILDSIRYQEVALTMPKFEFDSSFDLKATLSDMGMPAAFSDEADLSGMDGSHDLFITDVVHKAFVSVDEAGTEAAAATAVIVGLTAVPAQPVTVNIDRPFIFMIRDIETGALLFVGRILDPSAS